MEADLARKRRLQYLIIAGFAAIAVIVALIAISQSGGDGDEPEVPGSITGIEQVNAELDGIPQDGTVLGDPSASVAVAEYGDLQCPVCAEFSKQILPEVISTDVRSGTATYEFKPWDIIGPQSPAASKAALAAAEQDRYFAFIQLFYLNQGEENSGYVTDEFLTDIANAAGVPDIDKWNEDRNSDRWDAILDKNDADATSLGFTGTPSILVTGPNGQQPLKGFGLEEIQTAIQQAG